MGKIFLQINSAAVTFIDILIAAWEGLKSDFKEIVLKLATNGQSGKGSLLTSTFVPKGLSAPALGLYTRARCQVSVYRTTGPLILLVFRSFVSMEQHRHTLWRIYGSSCHDSICQSFTFCLFLFFSGASLLWSNIIMLLFKFKNCGPLPAVDGSCHDSKFPLVKDQDDIQALKSSNTSDRDHVLV